MDCPNTQNLFSAVADNDIDIETKGKFDKHLRECKACAHEWEHFQATLLCLKSIEFAEPPPDLLAGIKQKLDHPHPFIRFINWLKHANPTFSLPTATATVAVAFACMLLYKNTILNRQPVEAPLNIPVSAYHTQNTKNNNSEISEGQVDRKAFAFRQDLVQPAANPNEQISWSEKKPNQLFSYSKNAPGPTPEALFNSYIHGYLRQEFVHTHYPDIAITIHPRNQESFALLHHVFAKKNWRPQAYGQNLLLVTLERHQLPSLQKILAEHWDVSPLPANMTDLAEHKTVKIAINLK